jgi:hypothetical protein
VKFFPGIFQQLEIWFLGGGSICTWEPNLIFGMSPLSRNLAWGLFCSASSKVMLCEDFFFFGGYFVVWHSCGLPHFAIHMTHVSYLDLCHDLV